MTVLFHVSTPKDLIIRNFEPRVPFSRLKDEDGVTPRVCTSSSISGCLKASPSVIAMDFTYLPEVSLDSAEQFIKSSLFTISLFNTGEIGYLYRLYEFENVDPSIVRSPKELHEHGCVPDALITQEHWIVNEKIRPSRLRYLFIPYWAIQLGNEQTNTEEFWHVVEQHFQIYDSFEEIGEYYDTTDVRGTHIEPDVLYNEFTQHSYEEELVYNKVFQHNIREVKEFSLV